MAASSKETAKGTKKAPSADRLNKTGKPADIELREEDLKKVSGGAIKIILPDHT